MFSVNPLYDAGQGEFACSAAERHALYARCEKDGIGIVAMKPFCGGQLLDAAKSAFGIALTKAQCIQYALDKPGVVCAVPGFADEREMEEALQYLSASDAERDYAILGSAAPKETAADASTANIAILARLDWILHSSTSIMTWQCLAISLRGSISYAGKESGRLRGLRSL